MKKRVTLLLTLLLMCVVIPLQRAVAVITIKVIEDTEKITTIDDTKDIIYNLRVSNTDSINYTLYIGLTSSPDSFEAQISEEVFVLAADASKDLILRIPRSEISAVGRYTVTVTAYDVVSQIQPVSATFVVRVIPPINVQSYDITLNGVGSLQKNTQIDDTEDVTYTLRVTNVGGNLDQIHLKMTGDVEDATLDHAAVLLEPGIHEDVTLTLPRAALSDVGWYTVSVTATSENDATITFTVATATLVKSGNTILDDLNTSPLPREPTEPTEPREPREPTQTDLSSQTVVFSEIMFESEGGDDSLPQWIEVYNDSKSNVNLRGWKLQWNRLQPSLLVVTTTFKEDFIIPTQQARLIVTYLGRHSGGNLADAAVYQFHVLHAEELVQNDIENRNRLMTRGGFSLKLINPIDVSVDHIGTLTDDKQTWQLHECLIDGVRSSLIRRFESGVPRSGTERRGWYRAIDTKRLVAGFYYGHLHDLGTPGYRRGKPLPVQLSHFSAQYVKDKVEINWTTESELNNAGFNILRSTTRTKNFHRINTKLIKGAGTTGERTKYQFVDKNAKPDVVYYYRIEDVDLSGQRGILTTYRLRGVIAPTNKIITRWSTLKQKNYFGGIAK